MTRARYCVTGAGSAREVARLARATMTDLSRGGTSGSSRSWCRPSSGGLRFATVSNMKIGCGWRHESREFNGFAFKEVQVVKRQLDRLNCQTGCGAITVGLAFAGSLLCRCLRQRRVLGRGRRELIAVFRMALSNSSCSCSSCWWENHIFRTKRAPLRSAK
jgi:hypothetical protein